MSDGNCHDCGGFDVEMMYTCETHKGVEYCHGCECPYCLEDEACHDDGLDYLHNDEKQQRITQT